MITITITITTNNDNNNHNHNNNSNNNNNNKIQIIPVVIVLTCFRGTVLSDVPRTFAVFHDFKKPFQKRPCSFLVPPMSWGMLVLSCLHSCWKSSQDAIPDKAWFFRGWFSEQKEADKLQTSVVFWGACLNRGKILHIRSQHLRNHCGF